MTIKEFIEAAIEGGWEAKDLFDHHMILIDYTGNIDEKVLFFNQHRWLLDPTAWEAVGKVKGWDIKNTKQWWDRCFLGDKITTMDDYKNKMHDMIYALGEGTTLEEYIATL